MRKETWVSRSLDPLQRLSEVMFGLLMVLTFTGTMSVAMGEGQTVHSILVAALGCNIAWGIVDGVMHLLTTATERRRAAALLDRLRAADATGRDEIARDFLAADTGRFLTGEQALALAETLDTALAAAGQAAGPTALTRADFTAALAVFVVVVLSTFPPILPFLFVDDVWAAMRLSNGIAIVMLFSIGVGLDRYVDAGSRVMRWTVPLLGVVLVASTIALGG